MKLSTKLRLLGFILCCPGFVLPVALAYQVKLIAVDKVQLSPSWFWVEGFITILIVFSGTALLQRAARLSKEGK
jgi:hypothetical protein